MKPDPGSSVAEILVHPGLHRREDRALRCRGGLAH